MRFEIEIQPPQIGRARLITVIVLCALADVLWYWSAAKGLAGMRPTWRILAAGIVPWMVGWVTVLAIERRITRDLHRRASTPVGCPGETVPVTFVQPVEGEVLPR